MGSVADRDNIEFAIFIIYLREAGLKQLRDGHPLVNGVPGCKMNEAF